MSNTHHTSPVQSRCWRFAINAVLPLAFIGAIVQATGVAG